MRSNRVLSLLLALAAAAPLAAETLPAESAAGPVPPRLPSAAETPARPGLLPNGSFAVDFELARIDSAGGSFRLSDHVGPVAAAVEGGPDATIVAFMASWCGICHRSLPLLKKLKAEHGRIGRINALPLRVRIGRINALPLRVTLPCRGGLAQPGPLPRSRGRTRPTA